MRQVLELVQGWGKDAKGDYFPLGKRDSRGPHDKPQLRCRPLGR